MTSLQTRTGVIRVKHIFDQLASISSTLDKKEFLISMVGDNKLTFIRIAKLCYLHTMNYGVKDIKKLPSPTGVCSPMDLWKALDIVEEFGSQSGFSTKSEKIQLANILNSLSPDDQFIIDLIIKRNLQCGVGATMINDVFGRDTIFIRRYMRYSLLGKSSVKKLKSRVNIVQQKQDAKFCNIIITPVDGKSLLTVRSRDWIDNTKAYFGVDSVVLENWLKPFVLHGEVGIVDATGAYIERSESNGLLNSNDLSEEVRKSIVFTIWDFIPLDNFHDGRCDISYIERLEMATAVTEMLPPQFRIIESSTVNDLAEIKAKFTDIVTAGGEGVMIKDLHGEWFDGTSTNDFKLKATADNDFFVVDWKYGRNKYEHMIGAIRVRSCDGLVDSWVSGMSDAIRADIQGMEHMIKNSKVVAVTHNGISTNKKSTTYSLTHGRLVGFADKDYCDSLDDVIEALTSNAFLTEII